MASARGKQSDAEPSTAWQAYSLLIGLAALAAIAALAIFAKKKMT
jgi:hypothetical protein